MNEKISQLVDSELDPDQQRSLLESMSDQPDAQSTWRRYHLIGNVIRTEIHVAGRDLSASVMQRLEQEPVVLAPRKKDSSRNRSRMDVWKTAGMFAVAASLVLVAVVSLNPFEQKQAGVELAENIQTPASDEMARFAQEFDEMLAEHGEFTASPGLNGLIAYAKLVSNQQIEQ